jgi:hypothetical protein
MASPKRNVSALERATIAIFILMGIVLLAVAYWAYAQGSESPRLSGFWSQVLMNGGFVFLTVGALDLMWRFVGGNPAELTLSEVTTALASASTLAGDSARTGLARIFATGSGYKRDDEWMTFLNSAQEEVTLLSYTGHSWTGGKDFVNVVVALVNRGVKVRMVFMDETNPSISGLFIGNHGRPENSELVKSHIGVSTAILTQVESSISPAKKGYFQWRKVKESNIVTHVSRVDDTVVVVPYLMSRSRNSCPVLEIQGEDKPLFVVYQQEFERLWELGKSGARTT